MNGMVSFVIPHKGRTDLLKQTVDSILSQEFDLENIEIMLITQDPDAEAIREYFRDHRRMIIYNRPEGDSISALRNFGVSHCHSNDYLAFLDSDIALSQNWTRKMIEELEANPNRVVVCAYQETSKDAGAVERIRSLLSKLNKGKTVSAMSGQNLFLRYSSFRKIGGFPEKLRTCEDTHFTSRAAELGELYLSPEASYVHLGEDKNFRKLFKKEIWRARSNLVSLADRKLELREIPSILIPVVIMSGMIAIPVLLLLGLSYWALVTAIFCVLPILLYSIRLWHSCRIYRLKIIDALRFYATYFLARSIGSTLGIISR